MTNFAYDNGSQVAQIWAARLAEQDTANACRLARWQARHYRDPVAVPPLKEVAWLSCPKVEPIKCRG